MQGKFVGFQVLLGSAIQDAARTVFGNIQSVAGPSFERGGHHISITVQGHGGYLFGKVVQFNGDRTFLKGRRGRANQAPEVTRQRLDPDEEMAAVSYFLISAGSFCGLYFNYRGAYPFAAVRQWIATTVRTAIGIERTRRKEAAKKGGIPPKKNDDYSCECIPLIRRESIPKILAQWKKLSGFQINIGTVKPSYQTHGPLAPETKREIRTLVLNTTQKDGAGPMKKTIDAIMAGVDWAKKVYGKGAKTKLVGTNEHGSDLTIDLEEVVDVFDVLDADAALTDIDLRRPNHYDTVVGRHLVQLAEDNPEYFNLPSR